MDKEKAYNPEREADKQKVKIFMQSFEGLELVNTDGKTITLHIENTPARWDSVKISPDHYLVTFQGYPTRKLLGQKILAEENYLKLSVNYDENEISAQYAKLESMDLKSKNIYPQIRRHIGKNFPEGFSWSVDIDNTRTKRQMLEVLEELKNGQLTEVRAKQEIFNNYKIQERLQSGFNHIRVYFQPDASEEWASINVTCRKTPDQEIDFDVDFNL